MSDTRASSSSGQTHRVWTHSVQLQEAIAEHLRQKATEKEEKFFSVHSVKQHRCIGESSRVCADSEAVAAATFFSISSSSSSSCTDNEESAPDTQEKFSSAESKGSYAAAALQVGAPNPPYQPAGTRKEKHLNRARYFRSRRADSSSSSCAAQVYTTSSVSSQRTSSALLEDHRHYSCPGGETSSVEYDTNGSEKLCSATPNASSAAGHVTHTLATSASAARFPPLLRCSLPSSATPQQVTDHIRWIDSQCAEEERALLLLDLYKLYLPDAPDETTTQGRNAPAGETDDLKRAEEETLHKTVHAARPKGGVSSQRRMKVAASSQVHCNITNSWPEGTSTGSEGTSSSTMGRSFTASKQSSRQFRIPQSDVSCGTNRLRQRTGNREKTSDNSNDRDTTEAPTAETRGGKQSPADDDDCGSSVRSVQNKQDRHQGVWRRGSSAHRLDLCKLIKGNATNKIDAIGRIVSATASCAQTQGRLS